MKAELVADSVEANPFPYKATKTQNKARRKADPRRILHTNLVSPKTNVEAKKKQRDSFATMWLASVKRKQDVQRWPQH